MRQKQRVQYFFRRGCVPVIAVVIEDAGTQWQVLTTGSVKKWDETSDSWTGIHTLSESDMASLRVKARAVLLQQVGDGVVLRSEI